MTETTPLRELEVEIAQGCRVLSSPDLAYADGAEARLLEIVSGADDLSSSSQELAGAASDWGTTYSLVPTRANVARCLDLPADAKVLEIGCGCGPITRYLGEQCAVVDSVEPMSARAAVARARTRDLSSVEVYVGTLDDVPPVPTYDVVMVIGVLEYVGKGALAPDPYLAFLRQCHAVLKEGGTLVVAIENPLGVKYIAGAVEDHTNRPFDSLEGYALESPARTFTRRRLQQMLGECGFSSDVLGAFPDYKLPRAVMSDRLFRSSDQLVEALPRFPSPDYLVPRLQLADEKLTWQTLVASGAAEHFANSFIALAGKGTPSTLWPDDRQAVLFNTERQPEYAVRSEVRGVEGDLRFVRSALFPERVGAGGGDGHVRHSMAERERVVDGRELIQVMLDEPGRRADLLRRWVEMLSDAEWALVDLVPHNLVLTATDELIAIDQEWQVHGYDRTSVIVRGLMLTAVQLASRTRPERLRPCEKVSDLVVAMGREIGLTVDEQVFEAFCAHESAFQARVNTTDDAYDGRRRRSADELRKLFDQTLVDVRGGDRFDVQWERALTGIEELHRLAEQHVEDRRNLEQAVDEYRQAYEEETRKSAALRARLPGALAGRVTRGVLARARSLRRG